MEEIRFKVFENEVLKRKRGPNRDEVGTRIMNNIA
jgi:hypothetical protein